MSLEEVMKGIIEQQLTATDKYRHDCIHCVKVMDIPFDVAFCSFKTFPKGITTIIKCPEDCKNFFRGVPVE